MKYICICGEEFNSSQKFNNHKSHCKEHYLHKYGSLNEYYLQQKARHSAATMALQRKALEGRQAELATWLAEQHVCERCGKVMTVKFGSGRFCSKSCANVRDRSDETREKISKALINTNKCKKEHENTISSSEILFVNDPSLTCEKSKDVCLVCGKELFSRHKYPYCSEHLREHQKQVRLERWLETGDLGISPDSTIRGIFRNYIMEQQNHCCAICGMPDVWNNKPLVFILDHIDGDASYSARENLRLVCPNCDSQLDTYKSKNKNSARTARREYLHEIRQAE